jgi:hypothetical protein
MRLGVGRSNRTEGSAQPTHHRGAVLGLLLVAALILAAGFFALPSGAKTSPIAQTGTVSPEILNELALTNGLYYNVQDKARPLPAYPSTRKALAQLRKHESQLVTDIDQVTGTVDSLMRWQGTLTAATEGTPRQVAQRWLNHHYQLLGIDRSDIETLQITSQAHLPSGRTLITWRQSCDGISAYDNGLRMLLFGTKVAEVTGTPNRDPCPKIVRPTISASQALELTAHKIPGHSLKIAPRVIDHLSGANQLTTFGDKSNAWLVLFDEGSGKTVLAWAVAYNHPQLGTTIESVIDARTGQLLKRYNSVDFYGDAKVWDYYPGAPRVQLTNGDLGPDGGTAHPVSFFKWLPIKYFTVGHPFKLINADFVLQTETPDPSFHPDESFDANWVADRTAIPSPNGFCPPAGCSWNHDQPNSWRENIKQAGVQAFYFANEIYDFLRSSPIGRFWSNHLTENKRVSLIIDVNGDNGIPAQTNNTKTSLKSVLGIVNSAQISLEPYMHSATIQKSDIFSSESADIVFHEYNHIFLALLSEVLNIEKNSQATALDESLADFYAADLLLRKKLIVDTSVPGEVRLGAFTDDGSNTLRTEPIDCTVGASIESCPRNRANPALAGQGGYTFNNFGQIRITKTGTPISEPHADGEIMVQTLLDLRRAMVAKLGADEGATELEQLLTEAIQLLPEPGTFLQLRNQLLLASPTNEIHKIVWDVFAHRGMGKAATFGIDPTTGRTSLRNPIPSFIPGPSHSP